MLLELSDHVKKNLLALARSSIADTLGIRHTVPSLDDDPIYKKTFGAFVTLHLHGDLRGCIGYIVGVSPLEETIRDMAHAAAFRDPRFAPVTVDEFDTIDIEISVLSPIVPLISFDDIVIGRDGLIARMGGRSGLLLPQVATEYGWNVEEFLSHTCMKAGLSPDAWKTGSVSFETFSATVFGEKRV